MKKIILNLPDAPSQGFFLKDGNILHYKKDTVIDNFGNISSFFNDTTAETFEIEWIKSNTSITTETWGFNNNAN